MIKHIVLHKLKPGISRDDPRIAHAMSRVRSLPERLPLIKSWEVGINFSDRPVAYDFSVVAELESRKDLAAYGPHPAHQEVAGLNRELYEWIICDYEI